MNMIKRLISGKSIHVLITKITEEVLDILPNALV